MGERRERAAETILDPDGRSTFDDLSDHHRETLQIAVEKGYFEVPREGTLTDIAEELDVPSSEVSERLRHGIRTVLRNSEVIDE